MATVYRMVKETTPEGKTRWVRVRDAKDKRPGTWFLAYPRDGKQVKEATDAGTKAEAEALLKARLAHNVKAEILGVAAKAVNMTFGEFVQKFYVPHAKRTRRAGTYRLIQRYAKVTGEALGSLELRKITRGDVEQFITRRIEGGWMREDLHKAKEIRPATVNREVAFIRAVLYSAVAQELVDRNPVARFKMLAEQNERTRILSPAEETKLLAETPEWLVPIIKVALLAGLRRGEICSLKWKDAAGSNDSYVDLDQKVIYISAEAKDHEAREIPITPDLVPILRALPRGIDAGKQIPWVFVDAPGSEPFKPWIISNHFSWVVARAKLLDVRFHDLRRSFASRLAERGVSLQKIAKLLGHSDVYVTTRYAHLSDDGLKDAVAVLSKASNG